MKFVEKLKQKQTDNFGTRNPMIAFLGDSVTQGCFEVWEENGLCRTLFNTRESYSEKVKQVFALLYPEAPVNVVNAGVNGSSASEGLDRLRRDVICCKPDLLVVCFGLNDANNGKGVEAYTDALRTIFQEAKEAGMEVIFMTPNMMNTYTSRANDEQLFKDLAVEFGGRQLDGTFDSYIEAAKKVATEEDVVICDCYADWKKMYECGVDTTRLLSNGLNHPVKEMHWLFAWQLVNTILYK